MDTPHLAYPIWPPWEPPPPPPLRWRLALLAFAATFVSTTTVGARLAFNFSRGVPAFTTNEDLMPFVWAWRHPALWPAGLAFSLPLLAILLAHECGHYFACRHYGISATLPYFLPAPTLVGTLGAFIRIRSPFADRRQVFDVGVAGPIAGFVVLVPLLLWGLAQSRVAPAAMPTAIEFGWPPLAHAFAHWMFPRVRPEALLLSPLARAAWVGMFVTMLNLLPAAQLDGGHLLYALAARVHRPVSWTLAALLLAAGWFWWPGWYLWAAFIVALRARHPWAAPARPGAARIAVALAAAAIFALSFLAIPIWTPGA